MTTLGNSQRARTPKGLKVAPMSYAKLEAAAEELRLLLPTVKGYGGGRWKVDAWRVLEKTLPQAGYLPHIADVDELEECAAFTVPAQKLVVVRRDVYDGLFDDNPFSRSTVIHELSHIVLEHAVTLHRGAPTGKHRFYEDSEWQANALMAAVMMPIEACRAARSPLELADICGTSCQAATYRIDKLVEREILEPKDGFRNLL
ncbi:MAG TPA: ImmA/IrrE family metallo-endopeptidase [Gallionellaceae bacterium]|nr:ImmA/IrrE family metallo-endopeptidase [Gallionellaceae bacterium]